MSNNNPMIISISNTLNFSFNTKKKTLLQWEVFFKGHFHWGDCNIFF